MIKGQSTIKEFQIQNIGNGGTGTIRVTIPQVPWMSMVSTDTISSLAPYGKAIASIRLTPTDDLPLNVPVSGGLAINCANANSVMEPYIFEAISLETGDLLVDVTDEYTFYTTNGAHVDSAHVILKHPDTGVVIAQGITNENGTFLMSNIPEGNYTLVVEAVNHSGYLHNVFVEKGKVNEQSVFISFQPVTYSWNVVPTQIPDHYEITIIVEFVTNVPAPVVLIDMPDSMPHLENNETYPFIVTVTNKGLITAHDWCCCWWRTSCLSHIAGLVQY
jgi:hypothetical protein